MVFSDGDVHAIDETAIIQGIDHNHIGIEQEHRRARCGAELGNVAQFHPVWGDASRRRFRKNVKPGVDFGSVCKNGDWGSEEGWPTAMPTRRVA